MANNGGDDNGSDSDDDGGDGNNGGNGDNGNDRGLQRRLSGGQCVLTN